MTNNDSIHFEEAAFSPAQLRPLFATPKEKSIDLTSWVKKHSGDLRKMVTTHGAVFFRGFQIDNEEKYGRLLNEVFPERYEYTYWSTPRTHVGNKIYTTTEYPPELKIPQHIESAYSRCWPMNLALCCIKPSDEGGETPLSSTKAVLDRLPAEIKDEFATKGILYVRNYQRGIDIPWQTVFQTDSREQVNDFCKKNGIEYEWKSPDLLKTKQVCQALARHPETKQILWCNQAHLFHYSSIDQQLLEDLLSVFGEENLPRNAYYGDGSPIQEETLSAIRQIYKEEEVAIPWEKGDFAIVDNMQVHHGRNPFKGERRILITMGGQYPLAGEEGHDVLPAL